MAQYINKDTYVGDTGKQLKDIKTNADNIKTNSDKLDKMKDYISDFIAVNQGQNLYDKWYYITFGVSHVGMLYRRLVIDSIDITSPEGSLYYTEYNITLPSYFRQTPIAYVGVETSGGWAAHYTMGSVSSTRITGWIFTDLAKTNLKIILHVFCLGL